MGAPAPDARRALRRICRFGGSFPGAFVGPVLEFGVANGSYLRGYAEAFRWSPPLLGFDTFTGLPDEASNMPVPLAWRAGAFSAAQPSERSPDETAARVAKLITDHAAKCLYQKGNCCELFMCVFHAAFFS